MIIKSIKNKQLVVRALFLMVMRGNSCRWLWSSLAASFLLAAYHTYMKRLRISIITIVTLMLLGGVYSVAFGKSDHSTPASNTVHAQPLPPQIESYSTVLANIKPSVIKIQATGCGGIMHGSGFFITANKVATNAHVVAGTSSPKVFIDGAAYPATVIAIDRSSDLAILLVPGASVVPLDIAPISGDPFGTQAFALGYPGVNADYTITPTYISDTLQAYSDIDTGSISPVNRYAIGGHIIPGYSGGALADTQGHIIGVINGGSADESRSFGQAVPAFYLVNLLNRSSGTAVDVGACASHELIDSGNRSDSVDQHSIKLAP